MTLEDLKRCRQLRLEGEDIREEIEPLRSAIESTTPKLSGMPRGSAESDKLAEYMVRLETLLGKLYDTQVRYENEYYKMKEAIEALEPIQRRVMRMRYMQGLKWEDIAKKMHYSDFHCRRIRKAALKHLGIDYTD